MSKLILYENRSAVRATYAIGVISLGILVGAVVSFQSDLIGPSVVCGAIGGLLLLIAASRFFSLSSEEWFLAFDEVKLEFEWFFKARRTVVPVGDLEKVEFHRKMRTDGVSDGIVTFFLDGATIIDFPDEFSDIITIDKIKSICKAQNVIFTDCRD